MTPGSPPSALRLLLSVGDAAHALAMSRSTFYASVICDIRVVRVGRRQLVPISELQRWIEANACQPLDGSEIGTSYRRESEAAPPLDEERIRHRAAEP
jgi:excisionase family DNA binding protein